MAPKWLAVSAAAFVLLACGPAAAQETPGAERIEIGSAIFGGGLLFTPSTVASESDSRSYVVSAAVTTNLNRWIGLEGDVGLALGRREAHALFGVVPGNSTDDMPNVLLYGANLIYNPLASDRPIVPYVSVGAGGLTTFDLAATSHFGLAGNTTYPTVSVGGGIRWFPIRHWGFRGDYRYMGIGHAAPAAAVPDTRVVRSAQRVYGALVLTF